MADGPDPVALPDLRAELLHRVALDQDARRAAGSRQGNPVAVTNVDRRNGRWLAAILDEFGWPSRSLVGEDGAHGAWLLAQHADSDLPLQRRCLDLLTNAVAEGEARASDLAHLTDRVQMNGFGYQTYGTQFEPIEGAWGLSPLSEPDTVDERRRSVGLPELTTAIQEVSETYPPPEPGVTNRRTTRIRCATCRAELSATLPRQSGQSGVLCPQCGAVRNFLIGGPRAE